jgi:hypothetical protein
MAEGNQLGWADKREIKRIKEKEQHIYPYSLPTKIRS